MSDAEMREKIAETPVESYSFTYSEEEYNEANKGSLRGFLVRTIVLGFAFAAITAGVVMSDMKGFWSGMLLGWSLLYFVLSLVGFFKARKGWKGTKERICSSVFEYELFDAYMYLTVTRDGERIHFVKLAYENLISKIDTGGLYILNFANQLYVIKKQEIAENSIFHSLKPKAPEKPSKGLKALSTVFVVLTIVTLVCALVSAVAVNINSVGIVRYWWYLLIFLAVPMVSYGFGVFMKGKYNAGRGNIITGLLAVFLIVCVYVSLNNAIDSTKDEKLYSDVQQNISAIESYMGIYLPEPFEYENFTDSVNGVDYEDTAMQFDSAEGDFIEGIITDNEKWSAVLNDETYELVAKVGVADHWDYVCVYNITTDEYNKLPSQEGTYSMAAMYYDMEYNGLYVIEYEYVK